MISISAYDPLYTKSPILKLEPHTGMNKVVAQSELVFLKVRPDGMCSTVPLFMALLVYF